MASKQDVSLPFLLKALAVFLAADGVFKITAVASGAMPGPEVFGRGVSPYYYLLVAVVDISLCIHILGRVSFAWVWGLAFFLLQAAALLTSLTLTAPLSWVAPGVLGRIQILLMIALYIFLARYIASRQVRQILSPQKDTSE